MNLGPVVIMNLHSRKEHLSLESASPKVHKSEAERLAHDTDRQTDTAQGS